MSHHNIDDGWDLYTKTDTGPVGAVTIDQCVAHHNGTLTDGTHNDNADRNGFKLGEREDRGQTRRHAPTDKAVGNDASGSNRFWLDSGTHIAASEIRETAHEPDVDARCRWKLGLFAICAGEGQQPDRRRLCSSGLLPFDAAYYRGKPDLGTVETR